LKIQTQAAEDQHDVDQLCTLKVKQKFHHRIVQLARDSLKSDENVTQIENVPTVISFDLQKIMLLPKLTTGI
jgi:ubiquinone biosynthesis protein Coq4